MAEILSLPGTFNPAVATEIPAKTVLNSAIQTNLKDVVVIGRSIDGKIHVWGSQADADAAIGLLQRGVAWLSDKTQVS